MCNVFFFFLLLVIQWIYAYVFLYVSTCSTKKKVKNKAHVKAYMCETYIVKEISIIISYYLEPHMLTRINCVSRHDDVGAMSFGGNVSIFSHFGQPLSKNTVSRRYLTNIEFR